MPDPLPMRTVLLTRRPSTSLDHRGQRSWARAGRVLALAVAGGATLALALGRLDAVDARPVLARPQRVARPAAPASATVPTLALRGVAPAATPPVLRATTTTVATTATSSPFAFLRTSPVGPLRWDPCAGPIRYAVNLESSGAPARARADVTEAFRRLSLATGLTFEDAGTSTWDGRNGDDPVTERVGITVAWADARVYAPFADGVAGWTTAHWTQAANGRLAMQRSTVLLRRDGVFGFDPAAPTGWGGLALLHELGHAVGLEHVADRAQIMNEELGPSSPADFGPGDRAGLARLGAAAGCNPRQG